jgi:hypothetical protein
MGAVSKAIEPAIGEPTIGYVKEKKDANFKAKYRRSICFSDEGKRG